MWSRERAQASLLEPGSAARWRLLLLRAPEAGNRASPRRRHAKFAPFIGAGPEEQVAPEGSGEQHASQPATETGVFLTPWDFACCCRQLERPGSVRSDSDPLPLFRRSLARTWGGVAGAATLGEMRTPASLQRDGGCWTRCVHYQSAPIAAVGVLHARDCQL